MFSNLFIYVYCYVHNNILQLRIPISAKCLCFLFTTSSIFVTIHTIQIIDIYLRRRMPNSIQASVIQLQVVMKKYGQYPQLRQRQTEYANE